MPERVRPEMESIAVAIMAKAPRAGEVKTRLCPPLSPAEATELYRCFLLDKIEQVRMLKSAIPAIAYTPAEERTFFETLAPGFVLFPQEGPDLGARLASCFDHLLERGYAGALAVDSDTPTLPAEFLEQALALIATPDVDVVVGPSEDGGYYLIGLRRAHRELFDEIAWSTAMVLPETVRRAAAKRLRVVSLPRWFDVDTADDLERLKASLHGMDGDEPRHTRRFFMERTGPKNLSEKSWTTLTSRPIYNNRWLSLREDLVEMPDGRTTIYGVVNCGQCVGVLPFVDPDTVCLIRQYRYVSQRVTWEMPTGGVHPGESIEEAAQRELSEEIGYRADRLTHVSTYHTSKSVMDETAHLFVGEGLVKLELPSDETEFIEVRPFPIQDVLQMVLSGEIVDSMTIIAVLLADRRKRDGSG
jgi:rSAM/selenodomain-associated transferase 1